MSTGPRFSVGETVLLYNQGSLVLGKVLQCVAMEDSSIEKSFYKQGYFYEIRVPFFKIFGTKQWENESRIIGRTGKID